MDPNSTATDVGPESTQGNDGTNTLSSTNTSNVFRHRKTTTHRETMERIQQDTTAGNRIRHVVPDDSAIRPPPSESEYGGQSDYGAAPERWAEERLKGCSDCSPAAWKETGFKLLPIIKWLSTYQWKTDFLVDLLAGITTGIVIIPQSMSYAKLAGLPVEFGLYSSVVPVFAYAVFGTSRQMAVGTAALTSIVVYTSLNESLAKRGITPENTDNFDEIYQTMALQSCFLVGMWNLIMGLLRMGFIAIFLSHAVISGFLSGSGIIIGLSQVEYLFGMDIPNKATMHKTIQTLIANMDQFNWKTFVLGTGCIIILLGMKRVSQKFPQHKWLKAAGPLLVTIISIVLQVTLDLEARGVPIVGTIPKGFPSFTGKEVFPLNDFGSLQLAVISMVIVGFIQSIAISKTLATQHSYEIDNSQELVAMGMANLAAAFFGGYPVAGSISRSAINNQAGALSGLAAIVTAIIVVLVLLFLTPLFSLLPTTVLAAMVIASVTSLVDYPEAIYLWKVHRFDLCVWLFAFFGTLFLGVELGLGIAVGISLLLVIFESAYPDTAVLGRLPGTMEYRSVKQYPSAECYDGIVMVKVKAPIYFANTQNVQEKIKKYEHRAEEALVEKHRKSKKILSNSDGCPQSPTVRFIILELSGVSHVDSSALHVFHDLQNTYKTRNVILCLANPSVLVMRRLVASGLADEIGRDHIFVSIQDAVDYCLAEMDTFAMTKIFGGGTTKDDEKAPECSVRDNGVLHDMDRLMKDMEPALAAPHALTRVPSQVSLLMPPEHNDDLESESSVHV